MITCECDELNLAGAVCAACVKSLMENRRDLYHRTRTELNEWRSLAKLYPEITSPNWDRQGQIDPDALTAAERADVEGTGPCLDCGDTGLVAGAIGGSWVCECRK